MYKVKKMNLLFLSALFLSFSSVALLEAQATAPGTGGGATQQQQQQQQQQPKSLVEQDVQYRKDLETNRKKLKQDYDDRKNSKNSGSGS